MIDNVPPAQITIVMFRGGNPSFFSSFVKSPVTEISLLCTNQALSPSICLFPSHFPSSQACHMEDSDNDVIVRKTFGLSYPIFSYFPPLWKSEKKVN